MFLVKKFLILFTIKGGLQLIEDDATESSFGDWQAVVLQHLLVVAILHEMHDTRASRSQSRYLCIVVLRRGELQVSI